MDPILDLLRECLVKTGRVHSPETTGGGEKCRSRNKGILVRRRRRKWKCDCKFPC